MWTELGLGGGAMTLIGLLFRFQNTKIDKKVDQPVCAAHMEAFASTLTSGEKKFEKITDKLTQIGEAVIRIDERTKKTNGGV